MGMAAFLFLALIEALLIKMNGSLFFHILEQHSLLVKFTAQGTKDYFFLSAGSDSAPSEEAAFAWSSAFTTYCMMQNA